MFDTLGSIFVGSLNLKGLPEIKWKQLFDIPKDYWLEDMVETHNFFVNQLGTDFPKEVKLEMEKQEERLKAMWIGFTWLNHAHFPGVEANQLFVLRSKNAAQLVWIYRTATLRCDLVYMLLNFK